MLCSPSEEPKTWKPNVTTPAARYSDVGGLADVIQNIVELVEYPMTHPEIFAYLGLLTHVQMLTHQRNILVLAAGVEPPRGILLHGPSGCGKTLLAQAIAGELGVAFQMVSAPELIGGVSGESEEKVRLGGSARPNVSW